MSAGPYAKSIAFPCWPWAKGSYTLPKAGFCRFCKFAFVLGAFDTSAKSLEDLANKMLSDANLTVEFNSCVSNLIEQINMGKISERLKGHKKNKVMNMLQGIRTRVVETQQKEGVDVKSPHTAISVEKHPPPSP